METIELKASIRENSGKGPSRRYRMEGLVPAVVYSKGDSSVHLTVSEADMQKIIRSKKEKHFIKLLIDGEKQMEKISMLKELQYEPMSRHLYHADFYEIIMDHRLTVDIPLNFIGTPVGVVNGGELLHSKRDLKISCLPANMPDYIDVALAGLEIGDSLKVKDIVLPEGVTAVDHGDVGIVAVVAVKAAIVAPTETAAGEGAAPAEAAAKPAAPDKGKTK
ncbi:MAG: 50S ribosomal protein L25 [Syntrophales bacterium]